MDAHGHHGRRREGRVLQRRQRFVHRGLARNREERAYHPHPQRLETQAQRRVACLRQRPLFGEQLGSHRGQTLIQLQDELERWRRQGCRRRVLFHDGRRETDQTDHHQSVNALDQAQRHEIPGLHGNQNPVWQGGCSRRTRGRRDLAERRQDSATV